MKNYHCDVFQQTTGKWAVEIFCNSDTLACYGGLTTEDDAHLVAEAFIDGIKLIEGE